MNRETYVIKWSDGSVTVIYRTIKDKSLSEFTETNTYSAEQATQLGIAK